MSGTLLNYDSEQLRIYQPSASTKFPGHRFPRLYRLLCMNNRVSALASILRAPKWILGIVLVLVFTVETAVMLVLPYLIPAFLGETGKAILDAVLLTLVCAPVLWWVIIGPLRRIAIQEHQRSETIVANAGESILTFDSNGSILSCNRAGLDLFGVDADALVGQSMRRAIPELPLQFEKLPCDYRLSAIRPSGEQFPVQVSVSEYPSDSGELRIAILRDLTASEQGERSRIMMARETEALRAQQMATLAQLATGVAHEIRNPLTSIKMLIQVNRAKFAEEGLPTDDLELVEQEIRRMERSVNCLLDYARPEKSEFAKFAIQDVVRRTVQLIDGRCHSQKVRLNVNAPDASIILVGDAAQIQQLLLNLTLNSLDAMPSGGTLDIAVSQNETMVEVAVSDTGTGIDRNVLGKLFTPFVTTKPNGVGLGLGICRRIAEAHDGTLSGSNQLTRGAQFRLTLPIVTDIAAHTNETQASETSCKAC